MRPAAARFAAFLTVASLLVSTAALAAGQAAKKLNPREVARIVAEADKLAAEGKLVEARERYSTVLAQDASNAPAGLKLAGLCETLLDWECVAEAYGAAARGSEGPARADALAGVAAARMRQGKYPDAAEQARAAIALNAALAAAHVTLAQSLARMGAADALAAAEKAAEVAPTSAAAHATLGEAQLAQERTADAAASFRRALELDPKAAEAHAGLAEIQFRAGEYEAAIASATQALEIDSRFAQLYVVRGRAHQALGAEQAALSDLQHAVLVNPDQADAQLALADMHSKRRNTGVAENHYRKALSLDPELGPAWLGLAELLVAKNQPEGGEAVEQALMRLPESPRAHYLAGVVRERQKQPDEALAAYERAASLDPTLAAAHHGVGRLLREHKKDPASALPALEKALALDPENPEVATDLGVALYDAKQPDRAIEVLEKVVERPDYKSALGYAVLGLALKDQQAFDAALGWFEKAAALLPEWWLPHWGAAWSEFGLIKKGCPCGPEDEERVKRMKAHFDQMTALQGSDPALEQRVDALLQGQKIK